VSGKATRAKGRRGETAAKELLQSLDYKVHDLATGLDSEDLVATDPSGRTWSVEVKNTVSITTAHRSAAMARAKASRLPWMLMSSIAGTGCWLVQRQGRRPTVWSWLPIDQD
jgi:Holliday junction resolvase-like predicted endonuclease